jgi:hypothetical protein
MVERAVNLALLVCKKTKNYNLAFFFFFFLTCLHKGRRMRDSNL